MKVLSLFSGIGAFEKALDNLGIEYELVNYCEIDKYASKSYAAIHNVDESLNLGDITKVNEKELPKDIDLVCYGFPCQDISLANSNSKGLFNEDGSQTRSGLFFEALRIIKETQPRVAIAENVKNLTSKKFSEQFKLVLDSLEEAGYNNRWAILNAKNFGIPQNRERVFIVSIRKDIDTGLFQFPQGFPLKLRLKDMLDDEVDEKYYLSDVQINSIVTSTYVQNQRRIQEKDWCDTLCARDWKDPKCVIVEKDTDKLLQVGNLVGGKWDKINQSCRRVYSSEAIEGDSVNFEQPNSKTRRGRVGKQVAQTLTTSPQQGVVVGEPTIKKVDIPQTVKVRKYEIDTKKLCSVLREAKDRAFETAYGISEVLDVSQTKVAHWFRQDDSFAIPDADIWMKLKELLKIETDEFDEAIMTFEEKEGVYEKSERHYFADGIAPTLTSTSAGNEKFIVEGGVVNE